MLLEGLHIPLTTPFHPDGRLNLPKLAANVVRYSKSSAAGLVVLGPSGESTLLTDDESRDVLRDAAQAAAPEKVLLAGVSRDSVHATLALADLSAELHYDAVLVAVPSILSPEDEAHRHELLLYFQMVADRSPLPVVLQSATGRALSTNSVVELATHPNIIGLLTRDIAFAISEFLARTATVKRNVTVTHHFAAVTTRMKRAAAQNADSNLLSTMSLTGGTASVAEAPALPSLRTRTKSVGFQVLTDDAQRILASLEAGAVGAAPTLAVAAPQACYEVLAAWKDGDRALAEEKQDRLRETSFCVESCPGSLKFACDLNGYFGGRPRLPQLPPTGIQRAALEQLMKQLRN